MCVHVQHGWVWVWSMGKGVGMGYGVWVYALCEMCHIALFFTDILSVRTIEKMYITYM